MTTSQAQSLDFQARYVLGDRYHRVDYAVHDPSWTLDNVRVIDDLIDLGEKQAAVELPKWQDLFFGTKAVPYQPYPDANDAGVPG
jgi:hypothetical protein